MLFILLGPQIWAIVSDNLSVDHFRPVVKGILNIFFGYLKNFLEPQSQPPPCLPAKGFPAKIRLLSPEGKAAGGAAAAYWYRGYRSVMAATALPTSATAASPSRIIRAMQPASS